MKMAVITLILLTLPAQALEDDLFWSKGGNQGQTARSFFWQGKTYQNIRIADYDGHNVVLTDGRRRIKVPDSQIPPLWLSATRKRAWPGHAIIPGPAAPSPAADKHPGTVPDAASAAKYTTPQEWETARTAAEARVREKAAALWKNDFTRQLSQVRTQMKAWDELYPRPGGPVDNPIPFHGDSKSLSSYPAAEEPFRTRSVPLPAGFPVTNIIEIRIYNNKRAAARIPALAAAGELAQATWPQPENADKREAEINRLMGLWEETNFLIESL
jgi:hypothetical protein